MIKTKRIRPLIAILATLLFASLAVKNTADAADFDSMMKTVRPGWKAEEIFTVGETINNYTPVGILDGLGAYELNDETVRVLANHELLQFRGTPYKVNNGMGGSFELTGARVSFFDIDKATGEITDSGLAYNTIYDADGDIAQDNSFLENGFTGLSRLCSSGLSEAEQFGKDRGLADRIYFTGEEDGGGFNPIGGAEWALDPETQSLWQIPDMGRGAWENITEICTGSRRTVAFILADDTAPFDVDNDGEKEAAPLYLYIGKKAPGDFLDRNGLRNGKLYVWVPKDLSINDPREFNTSGKLRGKWVRVDNSRDLGKASNDGSTGYDSNGYPTQRNLWKQAEALGAFQFSRPEDVATNPRRCNVAVLASTGRQNDFDGADQVGTIYTIKTNFRNLKSTLTIIYDGDADATQAIRSPDNLDWADDGKIYVQEDRAAGGLFGAGAVNPNEAGIIKLNPRNGRTKRLANIDRSVILDASLANPTDAFDVDAGDVGAWESSGILDVTKLFDFEDGKLFLFNVQAHGIEDQTTKSQGGKGPNPDSKIKDVSSSGEDALAEGGQLLFLVKGDRDKDDDDDDKEKDDDGDDDDDDDKDN